MADPHANAAYSLVATAPSPATSGTTLVVTAGEGARFPSVFPYDITIWATAAQPSWVAGGSTAGNFEIATVTGRSTDTLTITRAQRGTTARTVVVGDQVAITVTAKTLTDIENIARSARSSNTILAAADRGQVICATAAYTQTFTAAATLGAGWWCIVKNDTTDGTTVLTLDPNSSETIDTLTTATMYSGETRLIECDGSNFTSQMLEGGFAKFTPTGGNFIVPAGIEELDVVCVGSGGQGGGGPSSVSTAKSGGGGGGGGAVTRALLRGSDFTAGATVTVTVGAGGSAAGGGGAAGAGATGSDGSNGATTSFGSFLKAGGGGGGQAGTNASVQGGGGGSVINTAATVTAGTPSAASAISGQAATASSAGTQGNNSEFGGASGGGKPANNTTGTTGGSAIFGGPGGGAGGGVAVGNTAGSGGAGGSTQAYTAGGGAGGGGVDTKGTDGAFAGPFCGTGGGGGGSGGGGSGGQGRAGGIGGIGAGGGGGGASCSASSSAVGGTGGAGGAGECRVWYS